MTKPAAKKDDKVVALDTHIILVPSPAGTVPTPMPMMFDGRISDEVSSVVFIDELEAATIGSKARNTPNHVPTGGTFQTPPSNEATIQRGSSTVFIDDKGAARSSDTATTCNDPSDLEVGTVIADSTVLIGD